MTRKFLNLFLLVLGFIYQSNVVVGHFVPQSTTKTNENMNGEYLISNPNPNAGKTYSTLYGSRPNIEYFDVYSPPISTKYVCTFRKYFFTKIKHIFFYFRYGEVYWTMMDAVPIDPDLVARFKDKTMAIVGYESDQVLTIKLT